ncbi:restriction endonuclease subunit S [Chromobacterium alticapitis]|uniref:Restriction endonuclease subunit S n=1 Tax=Chromobacterium alticapitis TaxID=2073169 RepID=A0A2S5DJ03_9NEIS|nr:restriction endonuclease subunit S [Chromobacterium alticapitis]POZ63060.1 restriction endonuclease subunit S [Chromobacterium alticapitis]
MVPKGWSEKTLEDIALVERGKFSARPRNDPKYFGGDVPFVQTGDVSSAGTYLEKFSQTLNQDGIGVSKVFPRDTILITIAANIGDTAITKFDVACPDSVVAIKPYQDKADVYWLKKLLETKRDALDSLATQNAQKNINLQILKPFQLLVPPVNEQKEIAQILSTWDQAIATAERLLDLARQQKKALMQQLLTGEKRFPGFEGEWKVVKLGSIFSRVTTRNGGQSENVVTISGQQGLIRQDEYFNRTVASETLDNYFLLKKGQFAYNKSYSIGYPMGAIKRLNRYDDGVVTTLYICFALAAKDKADSNFFEHYFESGLLNRGLTQIAYEGGRAHGLLNVKPADFFDLKVPLPALAEQVKIAAILTLADQEIQTLQSQLDGLKQEKKALMQQLLTGKRRVQCAQDQAEA